MAEALSARAMRKEPTGAGRRYYGESLVDLAYEMLRPTGHVRGLDPRHHGRRILDVALAHGTSDFPLLLGNVLNKMLLPSYESAQPTFRLIAARKQINDFRAQRFLRAGDFPLPLAVGENGEITQGTIGENQETVTALSYGRIFSISRMALVNDDLSAFDQIATSAANRVSDFHNATFFSTCITVGSGLGPTLSDSVVLYNATHANIAATGVLSLTTLGSAREKMMAQTSLNGLKLNILPAFLVVSPASLTLAEQQVATIAPALTSSVNPFAGKLTAVGDANLTGTRFYVIADPARLAQYVYGYIGEVPLRFEVRAGWEVEGIQAKVVTDFACGAIEYRAGVTGAGA
jgi:hypothetical protein